MIFRLKELRQEKSLSRKALEEKSGVPERTIIALEQGINNPMQAKIGTIFALCKALKCKVYDLYQEEK